MPTAPKGKRLMPRPHKGERLWLGGLDSNQDNQIQSLMSYRLNDLPADRSDCLYCNTATFCCGAKGAIWPTAGIEASTLRQYPALRCR